MSREARETKRIYMNVPVEVLERIDAYADKMSINRTAAVLVLVSQALDSQKAMSDLGELMKMYQAEQGKTDEQANGPKPERSTRR